MLEPLNQVQTAEVVERLAGDLPSAIQERIVERSGGNPFFAAELVRGLAERGLGRDVQDLDVVPDTIYAAVLARLDTLSPLERSVVQAASVAGRAFRPATLAAVLDDVHPVEIDAAIEGMVARDLAVPDEGDVYTFRHVLVRDVAYGTPRVVSASGCTGLLLPGWNDMLLPGSTSSSSLSPITIGKRSCSLAGRRSPSRRRSLLPEQFPPWNARVSLPAVQERWVRHALI